MSAVPEEILVDSETWGTRELLEVIASRFFDLGNEGAYPNSWEVQGKGELGVGEQLLQLNNHLEPMGLVGSLENTNPPVMTIARAPSGSSVIGGFQQISLWLVMSAFMTLVGEHWFSEYDYGDSGFSEFGWSLFFFTAPVIFTLLLASYCRVLVARKFEVEVGHIAPIVFPIPGWWPFGIVGSIGQRKPDLVPMPNRRALGTIEVVVPIILVLSGSILTILGLILTPSNPPELTGAPTVFDTNLITGHLVESWMGSESGIRLQWLHPTGIAGIGLSIVGWGLMLPIPGFPGDRLLHAIIGPSEMRSGSTQTSIFLIVLFVMVVVFATAKWTPWIFLAFVAAWQRFNPDNLPQPIILDEHFGLEERFRSRFVAIAIIVLIAGMPGSVPSYEMEEYDAGVSTESWPEELLFDAENEVELSLLLEPQGVMPVSGWLQFRVEGSEPEEWMVNYSCSESGGVCRFDGLTQKETLELSISINPPQGVFSPHLLKILVDVSGFEVEHVIKLSNLINSSFSNPFWDLRGSPENPIICNVINSAGGLLVVESPYWESMNDSNISQGFQEICLQGHEGAIQNSDSFDAQGRAFGPLVYLSKDNETIGPWKMPINSSERLIQVNGGSWMIPRDFIEMGDILVHSDYGSPFCPSGNVAKQVNTSSNWSEEMGNYSAIRLTGNLSGEGTIGVGTEGWLAKCKSDGSMVAFRIKDSTDVYVNPSGLGRGIDSEEFVIFNREEVKMELSLEWHGDSPQSGIWDVTMDDWLEGGNSTLVSAKAIGISDLERAVWVTADDSGIIVHLSARCPSEGC
ncbi:MAG: hypothetical protein QGF32_04320 [Candidatus Thalassarchaeaceae archaeon]|nr:hypothetical protein [Candidatus Thalassarchaeaceae archaeon]